MQTADDFKTLGNKAFSAQNFDEAIKHFTSAIALDASNHVLYSNRSAAYASLREFDKARADAEKTVTISPKWAKGYSRLGAAHHGSGNLDAAREAYSKGLEVEPTNALLAKGLADVEKALAESENDPFKSMLNEGIWAKLAANPKLSHLLADQQFVGKMKAMIANPGMAMQMMQGDQQIMMVLLQLMGINMTTSADEAEEAIKAAESATAPKSTSRARSPSPTPAPKARSASPARPAAAARPAEPMDVDAAEEVDADEKAARERRKQALAEKEAGNAAYKKREFESALAHYAKAWELSDETEVPVLTNTAAVHFEMGNYDECIKICEQAVEVGRERRVAFTVVARALARAGNAFVKKGDLESAIKYYNRSLTEHRTPDTLNRLRETEKQLTEAKKAEYHNPELSDAARDRGNELVKQQRYADAVKEYTEAIARNEQDPRAYSNRAMCYHKLGAVPDALKDCELAIARDPQFVKAYLRKAALQHLTKEYAKCIETCEQATVADVDGKHTAEIQQQQQKCYASMYGMDADADPNADPEKAREERAKNALKDPEIQAILADPVMQSILQQMQQDPGAARNHMQNPMIAGKIRKLVAAGVLGTHQRTDLFHRSGAPGGPTGSGGGAVALEMGAPSAAEYYTHEQARLHGVESHLDDFLAMGQSVLGNLSDQRATLKRTHRRMLDAANTIGVSRQLMSYIERRGTQDKWLFLSGVVISCALIWAMVHYLR
ncbi:hypothetical protein BC828DRAFT_399541 [Blastocladiella britannica]|nr:hypothetical protein BC828DRAFT_399541 [Blastocladiella britannica]